MPPSPHAPVWAIPYEYLVRGKNLRKHEGPTDELARRILASQWIDPLVVWRESDTRFVIYAGFRRYTAIGKALQEARKRGYVDTAYLELVPCQVFSGDEAQRAQLVQWLENEERRPINFVDQLEYFASLRQEFRWSTWEIAEKTGHKEGTIRYYLRCAKRLSPEVLRELRRGGKVPKRFLQDWCKYPHEKQNEELEQWRQLRDNQRSGAARHQRRQRRASPRPKRAAVELLVTRLRTAGHELAAASVEWAAGLRHRPPTIPGAAPMPLPRKPSSENSDSDRPAAPS